MMKTNTGCRAHTMAARASKPSWIPCPPGDVCAPDKPLAAPGVSHCFRAACELLAILLTAAGHIAVEISPLNEYASPIPPQGAYNFAAAAAWTAYVVWRLKSDRTLKMTWGLTSSHFLPALKISVPFGVAAAIAMAIFGAIHGRWPPAPSLWLLAALYPVWGVAQQFVLQNLVRANLSGLIRSAPARIAAASALFSIAHAPNVALMLLTLAGGLVFCAICERHPNVYALGLMHGLLGGMAYHMVLGCDPLATVAP